MPTQGPSGASRPSEPTSETADALGAAGRRRLGVVIVTAAGMAGAWALVIWMMIRVVARQRELGRLQRRFVADISHELKTPLALIRLLADTLGLSGTHYRVPVSCVWGSFDRSNDR